MRRLRFFLSSEHTGEQIVAAVQAVSDCVGSTDTSGSALNLTS